MWAAAVAGTAVPAPGPRCAFGDPGNDPPFPPCTALLDHDANCTGSGVRTSTYNSRPGPATEGGLPSGRMAAFLVVLGSIATLPADHRRFST